MSHTKIIDYRSSEPVAIQNLPIGSKFTLPNSSIIFGIFEVGGGYGGVIKCIKLSDMTATNIENDLMVEVINIEIRITRGGNDE